MKVQNLLFLFASFLLSLLVAVSCVPSQSPTSTTSGTTSSATAPLRVGFTPWPGLAPWQVTQEEEIFEANKVDVDLRLYDYLTSIKLMAGGELDANSQALNDTISAANAGSKSNLVSVLVYDSSTGADQVIVREGINTIADLKDKKVLTEMGSVDHFLLLLGLRKAGMTQADIQLENRDMRAAVAAFSEGQVDAVAAFIPFTKDAIKRPGSKVLFSSKDFPGAITDHLVAERKLIDERPQDVQALVNSWFDTLDFISKNREKSDKIMAESMGLTVEEFKEAESAVKILSLEENLKAFSPGSDMTSLNYAAQQIGQFLVENQLIEKLPDVSDLFDDRFVRAYAALKK